jgi:hypothetical protein
MINFREPQPQETFPATPIDFDGFVYTEPNEVYNPNTYVRPQSVKPNYYTFTPKVIIPVSKKNTQKINVMENEGLPQEIKLLQKQNDYDQYNDYTKNGNFIWEESLRRDYKNTRNLNNLLDEYGTDYITIVRG